MTGLFEIHFHVATGETDDLAASRSPLRTMRTMRSGAKRPTKPPAGANPEEVAARFFLQKKFERDDRHSVRSLIAPERPEIVPDLQLKDNQRSPITKTSILRFIQTKASIPIFGTRAVVELKPNLELLAIEAALADVGQVSPITAYSAAQALKAISKLTEVAVDKFENVAAPQVNYFQTEDERWHLVYHLRRVPAAPKDFFAESKTHGIGHSRAQSHPEMDYLVDAHDGNILDYWSSTPTVAPPDVPSDLAGTDEYQTLVKFFGRELTGSSEFELQDPLRNIKTCDFGMRNIDSDPEPKDAIRNNSRMFSNHHAAVSAHYHASLVDDFLRSVLCRYGLDGKGMELISYINCTCPNDESPPEWSNATWWKQRMWYGQTKDKTNPQKLRSFAQHLDIIAHELAHGLTEFTADLLYRNQSGALNESFSDIFGIIIKNWDWTKTQTTGGDVSNWKWEIGPELGDNGLPLRDMRDPTRTGDPAHMDDYVNTRSDNGGVHTNSNIHNKAAYNVLVATDHKQQWVFTPREVALLYYLTLTRLSNVATFVQTKNTLLTVATTYFSAQPTLREKLGAITTAYAAVGIE